MPRVEFNRVDLQVVIRREPGGGVLISVGAPAAPRRFRLRASTVARWLTLETDAPIPHLSRTLRLTHALAEWTNRVHQSNTKNESSRSDARTLARITLDIDDPALAALAWEKSFLLALRAPKRRPPSVDDTYIPHFNFMRVSQVLLRVRHKLLAKNNPLGLVYTLYGPAHLKIAKDGKCRPDV